MSAKSSKVRKVAQVEQADAKTISLRMPGPTVKQVEALIEYLNWMQTDAGILRRVTMTDAIIFAIGTAYKGREGRSATDPKS